MLKILTTTDPEITHQIKSVQLARLGVEHHAAASGAALLAEAQRAKPQVIIVGWSLSDMTTLELGARLVAEEALRHVRVILALPRASLDAAFLKQACDVGCDDLLVLPAADDELCHRLVPLLGLSSHVFRGWAELTLDESAGGMLEAPVLRTRGRIMSFGPRGVRLALYRPPEPALQRAESVSLLVPHPLQASNLAVHGRPTWHPESKVVAGGVEVEVEIGVIDSATKSTLAFVRQWEVVASPGRTLVVFHGDLTESTEFGGLAEQLSGTVDFDVGMMRYLNSTGVRSWVHFLEKLTKVKAYRFVRCSTAFVIQATVVARLLGSGHVEAFWAPFVCTSCEREAQRLLPALRTLAVNDLAQVRYRCGECNGTLVLDEMPERVLSFLESAR